jgi:hypothetical protein
LTTTYLGRGPEAEEYDRLVQARTAVRIKRKADREAVRTRIESDEKPIVQADSLAYNAYTTWKISTGWYRHGRAWRRTGRTTMRTINKSEAGAISKAIEIDKARRERLALGADVFIAKYNGDIAQNALTCLLAIMTDNEFQKAAYKQTFLQLYRSLLADQQPCPITQLVAHQLSLSWLDSSYWDAFFYTQAHEDDLPAIDHYDRRRARAARRLARSIKVYADVMRINKETVRERLSQFDLMGLVKSN